MAQPTVESGQDLSLNDMKLDELSLDDDALFADLDNEVRLEGTGDGSLSMGGKDDLNLDFDVEAVAKPKGAAPAKSGNGKSADSGDALNLDLDDAKLGDGDLELNLDELPGPGGDLKLDLDEEAAGDLDLDLGEGAGDLNLDLDEPAAAKVSGGGAPRGDMLDLDLPDAGAGGDLNLDLNEAPAAAGSGDALDLDLPDAGLTGDDLDLDLEEPRAAAPEQASGDTLDLDISDAAPSSGAGGESLDLDIGEPAAPAGADLDLDLDMGEPAAPSQAMPATAPEPELETLELGEEPAPSAALSGAALPGAEAQPAVDLEDLSRPVGAEQLHEVELGEESPFAMPSGAGDEPLLDMEALPVADSGTQDEPGEFRAVPDVDLDAVDLSLDQTASEFKAVPDVDLDSADLSLDMPLAQTHGDEGAAMVAPGEMAGPSAPAGPAGPRLFTGMGTGGEGRLEMPQTELLELNLSDLEGNAAAPAEKWTAAPMAQAATAVRQAGRAAAAVPAAVSAALGSAVGSPVSSTVGSVLLSIPHQVQVRMGSVSLLGEEIMNLSHGSVVPLNRAVGEPVDLTLDGKTIAQGEIVVINGRNLGVRIVAVSQ